ncbi:MAG: DUF4760 domain-containing protein [Gallionella sp.]
MDCHEAIKIALWMGESMGFWIQTGAVFLSAIAAIFVIYHNGVMARRRATVDHIIHQKSDDGLLSSIRLVYQLYEEKTRLSDFLESPESSEYQAILKVLNNHEFIALGIRRAAFEEKIYKELQYSNFVKVYEASAGIVAELRRSKNTQTLFQEFEWLIKRWKKSPLIKHT